MERPLWISLVGAAGFLLAAVLTGINLRRDTLPLKLAARLLGGMALLLSVLYIGFMIGRYGWVETFRYDHEAAVLLAFLLGAVGVGISFARSLRGLEGLLLLLAGLLSAAAWTAADMPRGTVTYHRWFVSHSLAFAVAAACWIGAGVAGAVYLLVYRLLRRKRNLGLVGRIPSLEALERFGRWMLVLGFPLFTYGILTGVCGLAHPQTVDRGLWYRDPTVLLALLVWAGYGGGLLVLVFVPRLRGRQAAMLACTGSVLVIATWISREFSAIHR